MQTKEERAFRLRSGGRAVFSMEFTFKPRGVCTQAIRLDLTDGIVRNVRFAGGCPGNTQGVARLVEGMDARDVISRLRGVRCGFKSTSCPDQLANALEQALSAQETQQAE